MGVPSTGSLRRSVRILLDENIGAETDRWLRSRGHDVLSAAAADLLGSSVSRCSVKMSSFSR